MKILFTFEFFVDVASLNFLPEANVTRRQQQAMPNYLCRCQA